MEDILFDASRLVSRTERTAPTGVDRVCLAYAEWLMARQDVRMVPVRSKHDQLVAVDGTWFRQCVKTLRQRWTGEFFDRPLTEAERRLFAALHADRPGEVSVLSTPPSPVDRNAPRRMRVWKQFFRSRRMPEVPPGRRYFNVGHTSLNTPEILNSLTASGIERIVLLHDLIPITHPEFCRPGDGEKHRTRVLTALNHASRILVNSHYTASELKAFADREGVEAPPIDAIHLGLEPIFLDRPGNTTPRPYFVHVGTIEARKNLAFLLTIWRRLQEKMGDDAPQLVLVGRYGWENEAVLDHLQRSPNLRGLVHQAANLPDASLAALMKNAQAVLAPSSVEGFDLPAVEACALGVPLIASDIPAHRELVPDAELIDPLDGLGWLAALERATRSRPVSPPYVAPTWDRHFAAVAARIGLDT
jgi:glycosyltransferase involved in cell wall biosynthesis